MALLLAAQPQDIVVDRPVFTEAAWRIALPRPAEDWVFLPATERGTMTVIFQPRGAALSDQLWGALAATHWDGPIPLAEVTDRRIAGTWRRTYGRSFTILARDSLALDGYPAIHLVMGGSIEGAVVDVEEYLVARDSDLVLLQFRIPRGQPRDTVAEGYQRVITGLDLSGARGEASPARPDVPPRIVAQGGQVVAELPESLMAVAPGMLTSQVVSGGRRMVRWTHDAPGQPDSLVAVGRYAREVQTVGRLTVTVWRLPPEQDAARVTDSLVAVVAGGWSHYWRAFGPVPRAEITLVETDAPTTRGATGIVFLGRDAAPPVLLRELARTWWGGYVPADSAAPRLVAEWMPSWSVWSLIGMPAEATGAERDAWACLGAALGGPRLREVLRTFAAAGRDGASSALLLSLLDPAISTALRPDLP